MFGVADLTFGGVDLLSVEHLFDPALQINFIDKINEQLNGFFGDDILRVIEQDIVKLEGKCIEPFGILRK